ncbi:MAG: sensor histidine kinase, partial [Candidatus Nitrosocosmicus sp.]
NSGSANYAGLVGVVIPTEELFRYYGNIYDIEAKYLSVLYSKGVLLAHPIATLIGKFFYGNYFQNMSKHNSVLNHLVNTTVISGKPSSAIYDFVNGQRFTTGYPVILNGKPQYSLFIITPTSTIYSKIDNIINNERFEMISLIAGIIAAIVILIVFLVRMNSILDRNVKIRTRELNESINNLLLLNEKLENSNKQLHIHEKMQRDFINVASHELRTPIQPILGLSKIVRDKVQDNEQKAFLDIVIKNAKRLKRLAEDILDVTRIEGNKFFLEKESVCIWELLHPIMKEFGYSIENNNKNSNKKIRFKLYFKNIELNSSFIADKNRTSQVISNLISNSIKFISIENEKDSDLEGNISITVEKTKLKSTSNKDRDDVVNEIVFSVKDNGKGIDQEIFPKLFTKFVSNSFQGTGLGLYICKSIVEAHGGKIWAKNNGVEKGATFSFSIPLIDNNDL